MIEAETKMNPMFISENSQTSQSEAKKPSDILIESYHGERPMHTLIDHDSLIDIVDSIINYDGQIMMFES